MAWIAGGALIRNANHNEIFTPNQDGVKDRYQLRFFVVETSE